MHRTGWGALLLLAWWPAVWADDPKDKPKSDAPAEPAAAYKALLQQSQKAQQDILKLFREAKTDEERDKHAQLDQATDRIRERFGSAALHRGSGLLYDAEHKPLPRPAGGPPPDSSAS